MSVAPIAAFVAAKGHSSRVPRKNMRDFGGRPLFHQILQTLFAADLVSRVILDSDSDEILDSARDAFPDIELIRRPAELCGDDVPMNNLILNACHTTGVDVILQTHATSPLLRSSSIDDAIQTFRGDPTTTSLFSVTAMQTRLYWDDLRPINHDPTQLLPTQDLPVVYEENSNIYIVETEALARCGHRVTDQTMAYVMTDPLETIDIDHESDFELAEAVYEHRRR